MKAFQAVVSKRIILDLTLPVSVTVSLHYMQLQCEKRSHFLKFEIYFGEFMPKSSLRLELQ
ncbi:hypothetical protein NIES1031_22740 [Chroogloeocystis siderophila 5.2 s.c.1]|uniref:Uncharacterized protein n=1 Tax=Chroogloeocystis siderophila 5.2 s.c.1 TaxID=247279 RepID=A0A1U7HB02_9CHRO|nr:hypothetical protein NIES1031_22740 [Chroogloeocystis siderophila 5.2 s.c.1]